LGSFCYYNTFAYELLVSFVEQSVSLYGPVFLGYNVHGLLHLVAVVELHDSLDTCSAFLFENHLKVLKHLVSKSASPMPQIVWRVRSWRAAIV
jgi:hypothetical protein